MEAFAVLGMRCKKQPLNLDAAVRSPSPVRQPSFHAPALFAILRIFFCKTAELAGGYFVQFPV